MITENEQRNDRAVSYTLDRNTLTVTLDGTTTTYNLPPDDGQWPDPPFPVQRAERRDGELSVHVIRTLNARGEPNESEPSEPVAGTVDWQPWPTPPKAALDAYARRLARDKRRAMMGASDGVDDSVLQSEFMSLLGHANAMQRREGQGRGKPGEKEELDELEAMDDALEAIDTALKAVRGKVSDGTYTTEADVDNAPEWP